LTARLAADILVPMDAISGLGSGPAAQPSDEAGSAEGLALLKKSQDLAKDSAARLLELLPPPRSANPPGIGGKIDLTA
jgi:hypothetical protein